MRACPLSSDGRALVANIVAHYIESAGVVAVHARPREAAFVMLWWREASQPANGDTLLADFSGTLSSSRREVAGSDVIEVTMDLSFPRLVAAGPITVHGEVRNNDMISGEIELGNTLLGSIAHQTVPEMGLILVEWTGACAQ